MVPRRVPLLLPRSRLLLLRLLPPAVASAAPALSLSAASAPAAVLPRSFVSAAPALSVAAPRLPLALPSLLPCLRVLPLLSRRSAFRSLQRLGCPRFRSLDQLLLAFLVVLLLMLPDTPECPSDLNCPDNSPTRPDKSPQAFHSL